MYNTNKVKRETVAAVVTVHEIAGEPAKINVAFPGPEARPNRAEIRRLMALGAGLDGVESVVMAAAAAERIDVAPFERGVTAAAISAKAIAGVDKRIAALETAISEPWTIGDAEDRRKARETADKAVSRYYDVDPMALYDGGYDGPADWFRSEILTREGGALATLCKRERARMIDSKARSVLKARTLDRVNAVSTIAATVSEHCRVLKASAAWDKLPPRVRTLVEARIAAMEAAAAAAGESAAAAAGED